MSKALPIFTETQIKRFWDKVHKTEDCWLWLCDKNQLGYGRFAIKNSKYAAHRVSYQLAKGLIPEGFFVLHRCDTPDCVNPSHLYVGNQKDNMRDMMDRERQWWQKNPSLIKRGEQVASAVLTEKQVKEIRIRNDNGESGNSLAREYGIGKSTVKHILNRRSWKHI